MDPQDNVVSKRKNLRLGEYLIKQGLLTKEKLDKALEEQKATGQQLGQILINNHAVEEKQLYQILASQLDVEYFDLFNIRIPKNVIALVPEHIVKTYSVIPVKLEAKVLTVAMMNPSDTFAIDEIRTATGYHVKPVISSASQINAAIENYYGGDVISRVLKLVKDEDAIEEKTPLSKEEYQLQSLIQSAEEAPIIKLVNAIINDAVTDRASDIHIEPTETDCRVRFRIDGLLHDITNVSKQVYFPAISRIKIMGKMDIAERRLPQDGSFTIIANEKNVDIRISTYPTLHGEKVVMRLLVREDVVFSLENLGFEEDDLKAFTSLIQRSCGIILVVGPTGCGKTTTLYSALSQLNSKEKNILTVEDPIEYAIPRIAQSQINVKAGFTFANSLRSMMRQDPDIILVGEIRDLETAELAIRASLTGHLVFSTLHTMDSLGAITRLIDMGIESFLIASSLIGVLAVRLIRKICPRCREPITPSSAILDKFRDVIQRMNMSESDCTFYHGRGCDFCKNSGFRGRDGIFELLVISGEKMGDAITCGRMAELRNLALEQGLRSLRENGFKKAAKGITALEEVLQVTELG